MSGFLGTLRLPKFTLKLPMALGKAGRTMSECPLELSFSLCDDSSSSRSKNEEQIPLQVQLPHNLPKDDASLVNTETLEKAEEENSEKQDNMEVTCSVSVDGQEKQEFSFTLYDFDTCERANNQDIEKVVVRSICEALNKTLKLPPSGSRTIKVRLAISPDGSTSRDTDPPANHSDWPTPLQTTHNELLQQKPMNEATTRTKLNDCCSNHTASTYLQSSSHSNDKAPTVKPPRFVASCQSPMLQQKSACNIRAMPSPKLRPKGRTKVDLRSHLRERLTLHMNASDNRHHPEEPSHSLDDNIPATETNNRDHLPECRDRRNHYLDLAGVESPKHNNLSHPANTDSDPKYMCPYRLLDRSHNCSKPHRVHSSSPLKKPSYQGKLNLGNSSPKSSPRLYRTKAMHRHLQEIDSQDSPGIEPQHDRSQGIDPRQDRSCPQEMDHLLNLDYDLSDLVPEAKFDWEKTPHHRRSKSYDHSENNLMGAHPTSGFYSPKVKPKHWDLIGQKLTNQMPPSSPGHQYRHRHRDKERQRAMQQVASWIAREHANTKQETAKQFLRETISPSVARKSAVERHEHHHLHEHVHHHYHHYVEF